MTIDLIDALERIKEECQKVDYCGVCPLRTEENKCGITNTTKIPSEWEMTNYVDLAPPRIFK